MSDPKWEILIQEIDGGWKWFLCNNDSSIIVLESPELRFGSLAQASCLRAAKRFIERIGSKYEITIKEN